jgi:hypothetical protein
MAKRISVESTAEAYLELLASRGVDYFFGNAGTDFAPLIESFAKRQTQGQHLPRPLTVPHETVAVAMAHGYTMVTGRAQVVMVHVIVGAANALAGVINAARCQVPMLFTAGRNPLTEFGLPGSRNRQIHWAQESFDQAGMLREWVKWDYELPTYGSRRWSPRARHTHADRRAPLTHRGRSWRAPRPRYYAGRAARRSPPRPWPRPTPCGGRRRSSPRRGSRC